MPKRSYRHISAEDRETMSLGLTHGHSLRTMAKVLGRAPSTGYMAPLADAGPQPVLLPTATTP
jgi:hypothetical protein